MLNLPLKLKIPSHTGLMRVESRTDFQATKCGRKSSARASKQASKQGDVKITDQSFQSDINRSELWL